MNWEESKKHSIQTLDKHKKDISEESYQRILEVIGNNALENLFSDEEGILNMIRIEKGETSADEIVANYKKQCAVA